MKTIMLLALTLSSSVAYAEADETEVQPLRGEPNAYVAAGGLVGQDHFDFVGFGLEAGHRINRTMFFGRVIAQTGNLDLANDPGRGTFQEARVGAEIRDCRHDGMFCASLGLDVGAHRSRYEQVDRGGLDGGVSAKAAAADSTTDPLDERYHSFVAVPRLTVDAGSRIRVRGVLELPQHISNDDGSKSGVALSLALGVGF
ncbi:MAG: hypothetical protein ABI867_38615 [Kofleriaceae bacterium]